MSSPERSCGPCRACCFTHAVSELSKDERQTCAHQLPDGPHGCGAYEKRPRSCRTFQCAWLEGHFAPEDRPDRLGVVITLGRLGTSLFAIEARPGAFGEPRVISLFESHPGRVDRVYLDGHLVTWPAR